MRISWITAAAILVSAQASAGLEQGLATCSAKADKLDRLICYDTLAGSVKSAPKVTSDATAISVTSVAAVSKAQTVTATGTTVPANIEDEFGRAGIKKDQEEADKEINKIYLDVDSIKKDVYGSLKISFTNGQVWKQSDSKRFKLAAGQTVYIEKGAFGAFYLGVKERNSTIKVKRLK
ncbi:hypothetical protein FM038_002645 [Shewanella eurypsychrophilus]|uniref:Uncharacterized protein n=1 Tax=Shewanella eurypsychrophilus TaxID=2593656 RepID=A0ABX6V3P6_9GAMM|nr:MULTISPECIES: hypothetical protein [Shewanella]QFU21150.1 hypothetical protein FS418_04225 [Shewanella sp. YLB-09]QPG56441.1 hypothetical protein FM038_002645 [Shewanella eurypsychrophilus]